MRKKLLLVPMLAVLPMFAGEVGLLVGWAGLTTSESAAR